MGSSGSIEAAIESIPASLRWNAPPKSDALSVTVSDSIYVSSWLNNSESQNLLQVIAEIGEQQRAHAVSSFGKVQSKSKYPLWTKYYGYRRELDGARALDRWGSNYESWIRVAEPPDILAGACKKLKKQFNLPEEALNSIEVNYYFDGTSTYIPAHRDTTTSLQDQSAIYCLSLGVARNFVLCSPADAGKYVKSDLHIEHEFRVQQGDLFVLGPQTNESYCHAVPQECGQPGMRISIIFRTVDKSFIDLQAQAQPAVYANNLKRVFTADCVSTTGFTDPGTREHIANLISLREMQKRVKLEIDYQLSPDMKASESFAAEDSTRTAEYNAIRSAPQPTQGCKVATNVVVGIVAQEVNRRKNGILCDESALDDYYMGRMSNLGLN